MKYLTTISLDSQINTKGKYSRYWTVQSGQRKEFLEQKQEHKWNIWNKESKKLNWNLKGLDFQAKHQYPRNKGEKSI